MSRADIQAQQKNTHKLGEEGGGWEKASVPGSD